MFVSTTGIIAAQIITNPHAPPRAQSPLTGNQALASLPLTFLIGSAQASYTDYCVGQISCKTV
jgi:hypothetical protein